MTQDNNALAMELELDAKAFRENTVYTADGDPIRLIKNAERMEAAAKALRQPAPAVGEVDADSGMNGDAVARAEQLWVNLPTRRKWASLETYEKALVCHMLERLAAVQHPGDQVERARQEAITLIDELNERATSRKFYGIDQTLHAKLCTIRATLARAAIAAMQSPPAQGEG